MLDSMKKFFYVVLAITLVVIFAYLGFRFNKKTHKETSDRVNPVQQVNLKTYRNLYYGYSIQYPESWYLLDAEGDRALYDWSDGNRWGGSVQLANRPNPSNLRSDKSWQWVHAKVEPDDYNMLIQVFGNVSDIQKFIEKNFPGASQSPITIGELRGIRLTSKVSNEGVPFTVVNTVVQTNEKILVFNYSNSTITDEAENLYQIIVNSLKLTPPIDPNKNSLVFTDPRYGIHLPYSPKYTVTQSQNLAPNKLLEIQINYSNKVADPGLSTSSFLTITVVPRKAKESCETPGSSQVGQDIVQDFFDIDGKNYSYCSRKVPGHLYPYIDMQIDRGDYSYLMVSAENYGAYYFDIQDILKNLKFNEPVK